MPDNEQTRDPQTGRKMIELPEGEKRGGDIVIPKTPDPSAPGRLDSPPTPAAPPSPPEAPSEGSSDSES